MNFIQIVPHSNSAKEFDQFANAFQNGEYIHDITKCLPQMYDLWSKGADMYVGSSNFIFQDKSKEFQVLGYRYQGVFYNTL